MHSRNRKKQCNEQDAYERYVRQRRIPRNSLLPVERSPWRRVYSSADDQAMITLTGFDMASFHYVCQLFAPLYDDCSPFIDEDGFIVKKKSKCGRPRFMRAEDCLGMALAWSRNRGSLMALQLIFGTTMTPTSKYLQFARRILVKVLLDDPYAYAKIEMPTHEKLKECWAVIQARHPALEDVWGTMDGLKLRIESASDFLTQSRFYNGWKCDHFVTGVLCFFAPDGTIPAAFFYNVPGCTHSTVADWGMLYEKLEKVYNETGLKFVIDSAFSASDCEFLIKSAQDYLTGDAGLDDMDAIMEDLAIKREAMSMRQSAEC